MWLKQFSPETKIMNIKRNLLPIKLKWVKDEIKFDTGVK